MSNNPCSICGDRTTQIPIFESLPISSAHLSATPKFQEGLPFIAGLCNQCDHVQNNAWLDLESKNLTPTIYGHTDYQLKTAVSQSMSTNLRDIANWIVEQLGTKDKEHLRVLEIASGSGELARWFADRGADVFTVDPSIDDYGYKGITHKKQLFSDEFPFDQFDLIIARHIIEHISTPATFLTTCSNKLHPNGLLYLEMPNGRAALDKMRPIEYFIDHIQHYSLNSIMKLIRKSNLAVFSYRYLLSHNHLAICAMKGSEIHPDTPANDLLAELNLAIASFQTILDKVSNATSLVIYGAGAHAATFVNVISKEDRAKIVAVFDKDVAKHGKYLPNTTVAISMPRQDVDADLIVNTAVLYPKEVEDYLFSELKTEIPILHATQTFFEKNKV